MAPKGHHNLHFIRVLQWKAFNRNNCTFSYSYVIIRCKSHNIHCHTFSLDKLLHFYYVTVPDKALSFIYSTMSILLAFSPVNTKHLKLEKNPTLSTQTRTQTRSQNRHNPSALLVEQLATHFHYQNIYKDCQFPGPFYIQRLFLLKVTRCVKTRKQWSSAHWVRTRLRWCSSPKTPIKMSSRRKERARLPPS